MGGMIPYYTYIHVLYTYTCTIHTYTHVHTYTHIYYICTTLCSLLYAPAYGGLGVSHKIIIIIYGIDIIVSIIYNRDMTRKNEMLKPSEALRVRLIDVASELSMLLDDDLPDAIDHAVIDLCDEFNTDNTDWVYDELMKTLNE